MKYLPYFLLVLHSTLVCLLASLVGTWGGEANLLWGLVMVLDFPISFMASPIIGMIESWSQQEFGIHFTYTITFAVMFCVLGGMQYLLLGVIVRHFSGKKSSPKTKPGL
jgi:hypothetical protein